MHTVLLHFLTSYIIEFYIINSQCYYTWSLIHIVQGCFIGTGAIVWLSQCQLSNIEWLGKQSTSIWPVKHNQARNAHKMLAIYLYLWLDSHTTRQQTISITKKLKQDAIGEVGPSSASKFGNTLLVHGWSLARVNNSLWLICRDIYLDQYWFVSWLDIDDGDLVKCNLQNHQWRKSWHHHRSRLSVQLWIYAVIDMA